MIYLSGNEETAARFNPEEDLFKQLIQTPPKPKATIEEDMTAEEIVEIIVDRLMQAATGGEAATSEETNTTDSESLPCS